MTHSELIESKGAAIIAERLKVKPGFVRVWKNRGIPRARFGDMMDAFPDVSLDMLKAGAPQTVEAA